MRFMYIVTSSQPMRGPTPALMEAMHKLSEREIKAGRMLDSGGLMPVAMGAQVKITDGKLNVVDGPFVETKETLGGYYLVDADNLDEAIPWPARCRFSRPAAASKSARSWSSHKGAWPNASCP